MHELPVTESILEIALRYAGDAQANRITDLYLVIGQLATIVDDSIQFYWDIIARDTIAEGARLHFKRIPTQVKCQDCQLEYKPAELEFTCPECKSFRVQIVAGNEFYMDSIEVE
ncbi:MAG: hydrogenase maturation nickel metallochaperone HypA [Anaerolineales bacterium]|nr:MAG: hydrogenase maturation nickel metallochaperone HypA [Anaerolineales bacterium]